MDKPQAEVSRASSSKPALAYSIWLQHHNFKLHNLKEALTVVLQRQVVAACGLTPHQKPAGQHCTCQHQSPC